MLACAGRTVVPTTSRTSRRTESMSTWSRIRAAKASSVRVASYRER